MSSHSWVNAKVPGVLLWASTADQLRSVVEGAPRKLAEVKSCPAACSKCEAAVKDPAVPCPSAWAFAVYQTIKTMQDKPDKLKSLFEHVKQKLLKAKADAAMKAEAVELAKKAQAMKAAGLAKLLQPPLPLSEVRELKKSDAAAGAAGSAFLLAQPNPNAKPNPNANSNPNAKPNPVDNPEAQDGENRKSREKFKAETVIRPANLLARDHIAVGKKGEKILPGIMVKFRGDPSGAFSEQLVFGHVVSHRAGCRATIQVWLPFYVDLVPPMPG